MTRPTIAQISLPALRHNLGLIKSKVEKQGSTIIPVIKADAYGHGAERIAKELISLGIDTLAVACQEEAVELRDAGVDAGIIVLGPIQDGELSETAERGIVPVLSSSEDLKLLKDFLKEGSKAKAAKIDIIIDVDTGMGRMGFMPEQMASLAEELKGMERVSVIGVFSHLAVAESGDEDDLEYTRRQIQDFILISGQLKKFFPEMKMISIANSAGVFFHPDCAMGAVRPGIMLYGVMPDAELERVAGLRPVMNWKTSIIQIREHSQGASLSYGRKTVLKRASKIALLPVGYADGLQRRIEPGFELNVRGKPAPIAGTITMDLTMIDVTDIPDASIGDAVLIMGEERGSSIRAEAHARAAKTIPYEILTSVGKRVKRTYLEEE